MGLIFSSECVKGLMSGSMIDAKLLASVPTYGGHASRMLYLGLARTVEHATSPFLAFFSLMKVVGLVVNHSILFTQLAVLGCCVSLTGCSMVFLMWRFLVSRQYVGALLIHLKFLIEDVDFGHQDYWHPAIYELKKMQFFKLQKPPKVFLI